MDAKTCCRTTMSVYVVLVGRPPIVGLRGLILHRGCFMVQYRFADVPFLALQSHVSTSRISLFVHHTLCLKVYKYAGNRVRKDTQPRSK